MKMGTSPWGYDAASGSSGPGEQPAALSPQAKTTASILSVEHIQQRDE
jgi:hypothetical protein